jgi:hypothetical protein
MNLFLGVVLFMGALFILRNMVVFKARMDELDRLNVLINAGKRINKELDEFERTSRSQQILDLRKWTHKQFFKE